MGLCYLGFLCFEKLVDVTEMLKQLNQFNYNHMWAFFPFVNDL